MKETTNKTTTPTTFADLVARYNADPRNADHLIDLANAVANSVLKKVIDPQRNGQADRPSDSGQNPALIALRNDLTRDRAYLARLDHAVNGATRLTFDPDGNIVSEEADRDLANAVTYLSGQTLGDGLDLVNDAVVSILEETAKQAERDPGQPVDMERPYLVRRLKRKVWIKTEDIESGWETVDTTPIQEAFKAVRRAIQNSRAVQTDPRNGYTYLADLAVDPETGDDSTIYRRLSKYADMGGDGTTSPAADYIPGQPAGLDGKPVLYSADRQTAEDLDRLVAALNLSDQQATILKYRIAGYGHKAIANTIGVRQDSVTRQVKRIREKAVAAGMTPPTTEK